MSTIILSDQYAVSTNIIYGCILYFLVTWLARHSLLYAYIGNLVMVALGLAMDIYVLKYFTSPKIVAEIKKEKHAEQNYRVLHWFICNYISFKAMLYLFYAFLLIASQIINFGNITVGEDLNNFLRTTDYSILIVIAVDEFIERFSQGRKNAEIALEKLRACSGSRKRRLAASSFRHLAQKCSLIHPVLPALFAPIDKKLT